MSEHKNNKLFHMPGKPSKKAIIAIVCVLALAAIAFILVSSGIAGRILGSGNVSFTPLDAKDIPRAIEKDVIPEYRELERALGCVVDGKVYINGSDEPLDEPYIREPMIPEEPMHFEVPENSYFMMGDNRTYSADARFWRFSYISKDKIIAKVLFKYFPGFGKIE